MAPSPQTIRPAWRVHNGDQTVFTVMNPEGRKARTLKQPELGFNHSFPTFEDFHFI